MSGDAAELNLVQTSTPGITYFPGLLEGDLLLSYEPTASSSATGDVSGGSVGGSSGDGAEVEEGSIGGEDGVLWSVQASVADLTMMTWTVFPSTGLLLPGEK